MRLSPPQAADSEALPLASSVVCIDLDGTLIKGDLLWEAFISLLIRHPARALIALFSLSKGIACFKRTVALQAPVDVTLLPYRRDLIEDLEALRDQGVSLVLATASDKLHAQAVADHLAIFSAVVASDGRINLSGRQKAEALVARYGVRQFDYIANSWSDVSVWRSAAAGIAVAAPRKLLRQGTKEGYISHGVSSRPAIPRSIARALRPHQWVKNLLVFVPAVAAHTILQTETFVDSALTFVVFSLTASAIYIINDIADIDADRRHPRKRLRPFAAGDLTIPAGIAVSSALITAAFGLIFLSGPWQLLLVMAAYLAVTLAYSASLKRQPVVDVFALTALYVTRIVAGGVATNTRLSTWLLAFALFLFLSLAFIKRYSELLITTGTIAGRGYHRDDALWMHAIGTSSGFMAVLVLALYVNSPEVSALYTRPQVIWFLCPILLFWLTRLWFRAGRGRVNDDPVLDSLQDPVSYLLGVVGLATVIAAV